MSGVGLLGAAAISAAAGVANAMGATPATIAQNRSFELFMPRITALLRQEGTTTTRQTLTIITRLTLYYAANPWLILHRLAGSVTNCGSPGGSYGARPNRVREKAGKGRGMGLSARKGAAAFVAILAVTGCAARSTSCQCPKPVAYDEATLQRISQALHALPADNVLHQAMEDYENERDDLRFCP